MQLTLPDDIQSTRWAYSVTGISLAPGLTEVTVFGGTSSHLINDCITATTIVSFGESNPYLHHVRWMIGLGFRFHVTSLSSTAYLIGVSLSELHINGTAMREFYIMYGTSVT